MVAGHGGKPKRLRLEGGGMLVEIVEMVDGIYRKVGE
jgi:hypothetical protein